jgi:anti-anti-sigma factor
MSTVHFQHIKTNMVHDVAVVEVLSKELRFPEQARELASELALVAGQDWAKRLLINMKHTKYISSTGFAVLVNVVKQSRSQEHEVKFCALDPEVQIGADIIGLDKIAEIHETEHAALHSFSA